VGRRREGACARSCFQRAVTCRLSSGYIPKGFYPLSCFSSNPRNHPQAVRIPGAHGIALSSIPALFLTHPLTHSLTRYSLPALSLAHARAVPCPYSHSLTHLLTRCPIPALIDAIDTDYSTVELNLITGIVSTLPLIPL
jgi:hypothetical protein